MPAIPRCLAIAALMLPVLGGCSTLLTVAYLVQPADVAVDHVVGIDLEEFRFHEGSTLYRGRASVHVKVYDVAEKKLVFERRIDDFAFPANSAIPATDRSEAEFRSMFLEMLSLRISRLFHAYESRAVFAEDNLTF